MRICWRMGLTPSQWRSLPDADKLDLLAWDAHRQTLVEALHAELAAPREEKPEAEKIKNGLTYEVFTLIKLAEYGLF